MKELIGRWLTISGLLLITGASVGSVAGIRVAALAVGSEVLFFLGIELAG